MEAAYCGCDINALPGPLIDELERDGSAKFEFLQGRVSCGAGPGILAVFEPPYFSFYNWPRTFDPSDDDSMHDAYALLEDTLAEKGPFDGLLGFSHGGTLAAGYLGHLAKKRQDLRNLPVRCAVFLNALPPFRVKNFIKGKSRSRDIKEFFHDEGLEGCLTLPTLHVVSEADFIYQQSMKLYDICDSRSKLLIKHDGGHGIPTDPGVVKKVAATIRELGKE